MLPCICSVIDYRWRQNVVRTKKWLTRRSQVCHWCSYHILTCSVIYYGTDARQHGIYLFYRIKKLKYTEKMPFYFKFRHFDRHENGTDVILCLYKKTSIVRCRHLCVCPLIDHRREPIRMRELLGLLYNRQYSSQTSHHCNSTVSHPTFPSCVEIHASFFHLLFELIKC